MQDSTPRGRGRGGSIGFKGEPFPTQRNDSALLKGVHESDARSPGREVSGHATGAAKGPLASAYESKQSVASKASGSRARSVSVVGSYANHPAMNDPRMQAMGSAKRAQMEMMLGDTNNPNNPMFHMPAGFFQHVSDLADNPAVTPQEFGQIMQQGQQYAQQHQQYAAKNMPERSENLTQIPGESDAGFQRNTDRVGQMMGGADIDFRGQTGMFAGHNALYKQGQQADPIDSLNIPDSIKASAKAARQSGVPPQQIMGQIHNFITNQEAEKAKTAAKSAGATKESPFQVNQLRNINAQIREGEVQGLEDDKLEPLRKQRDTLIGQLPGGPSTQSGPQPHPVTGLPVVGSQEDYDKLPPGSHYHGPNGEGLIKAGTEKPAESQEEQSTGMGSDIGMGMLQ